MAAAGVAAALLPLSACGAGIQAATSRERPTIDGAGAAIGTITIRNTYVGGPADPGASAPVLMSVFNDGNETDRLVSVSSPAASGSSAPAQTSLPPGGQQLYYTAASTPRLTGLSQPIRVGDSLPLVLTFERAGQVQMTVPVETVPADVLQGGSSASPSAGTSASGSASPSTTPPPAGLPSGAPSASPSATPSP
jgi:copper(I)-binding protein